MSQLSERQTSTRREPPRVSYRGSVEDKELEDYGEISGKDYFRGQMGGRFSANALGPSTGSSARRHL